MSTSRFLLHALAIITLLIGFSTAAVSAELKQQLPQGSQRPLVVHLVVVVLLL